jgi:hypothetical protein
MMQLGAAADVRKKELARAKIQFCFVPFLATRKTDIWYSHLFLQDKTGRL